MVKITFENVAVKLGKAVDPRTLTEISLPNTQVTEVGSFEKFSVLSRVDLSLNRICFARQITGLFGAASTLTEVNLSGNPICTTTNYRLFMIFNLPKLELLDGTSVTDEERSLADKVIGKGEKVENITSREGEEEEAAEIARLNEEASRTRIDPELKKKAALEERQRLYEAETAEAERIAALLGQPLGTTPIEAQLTAKEKEELQKKEKKEREAREKAEKKAEKEREEKEIKEQKAAAKAAADATKAAEKKAKDEAEAVRKAEEAQKKAEAQEKLEKEKLAAKAKEAAASPQIATTKAVVDQSATQSASNPETTSNATSATTTSPKVTSTPEAREQANLSFKDARSGLAISTALSDSERIRSDPVVQPVAVPKRQTATEESIFGSDSVHRSLDISSLPSAPGQKAKASLFGDDDDDDLFFSKATSSFKSSSAASGGTTGAAKASAASTASKPSTKLFDDDDDDLMSMLTKKSAKSTAASSASTAKKTQPADDIFAMLDADKPAKASTTAKKSSFLSEDPFDVDSFISSTKSSSGGLFDD